MNLGLLLSADWCGHCQRFLPVWQEFNKEMGKVNNLLLTNLDNHKIDNIQKGGDSDRCMYIYMSRCLRRIVRL